jgi:Ca2+-binding RTX toxin-like protein
MEDMGRTGEDTIRGGAVRDAIFGPEGRDRILGDSGSDTIISDQDNDAKDFVDCGAGYDPTHNPTRKTRWSTAKGEREFPV